MGIINEDCITRAKVLGRDAKYIYQAFDIESKRVCDVVCIRFQAWDDMQINEVVVDLNGNPKPGADGFESRFHHEVKLLKCTGRVDIEGILIYEGDIVSFPNMESIKFKGEECIGVVNYDIEKCAFVASIRLSYGHDYLDVFLHEIEEIDIVGSMFYESGFEDFVSRIFT